MSRNVKYFHFWPESVPIPDMSWNVISVVERITQISRDFLSEGKYRHVPERYLVKIALINIVLDAVASQDENKALGGGIHNTDRRLCEFYQRQF